MANKQKKVRTKKASTAKTKTRKPAKKMYVAFILDESGSMETIRTDALGSFNQQIKDIRENSKKTKIKSVVSFVKFNTVVSEKLWNADPDTVKDLDLNSYTPGGSTAMLDAVGYTIDKLKTEKDIAEGKASVLVLVISDGMENASTKETYQSIAEKIQDLTKKGGWTFTYSGANQDLSVISQKLNIPVGNMQNFVANSAGMKSATRGRTLSTEHLFASYQARYSPVMASEDFYIPVRAEKEEDKKTP